MADSFSPDVLAAHLRASVSALVRGTRAGDQVAPIPAAVLDLLAARGPMTTADLAASRGVRHQTMAATVRDLADAGHLSVGPDPEDARKKILSVTEAGRRAMDADRQRRVGVLAEAVDRVLSEEEQELMARALELIDRVAAAVAERRGGHAADAGGRGENGRVSPDSAKDSAKEL